MNEVKAILNRIKNLKQFEVAIDTPEELLYSGDTMPFDLRININRTATVFVLAETQQEAEKKVKEYFESRGYQ
jgi:hypothetical protein